GMAESGCNYRIAVVAQSGPWAAQTGLKVAVLKELWAHARVSPQNQNHVVNVNVSCAIQEQQEISHLRGGVSRTLDCPRISYRQPPAVSVSNNISPGAPHRRAVAGEPIARPAVILAWIDELDG